MKKKHKYSEEEFQECLQLCLNSELKEAIAVIEHFKKENGDLKQENERLERNFISARRDAVSLKNRLIEMGQGLHEWKFHSEICTYRPIAIKELKQKIIEEMDEQGCIEYADLEDGTVSASVRVLDWKNSYDIETSSLSPIEVYRRYALGEY